MLAIESSRASFKGADPELCLMTMRRAEDIARKAILGGVLSKSPRLKNAQPTISRTTRSCESMRTSTRLWISLGCRQPREVLSIELAETTAETAEPVVPF
jgi:hypothetical protein